MFHPILIDRACEKLLLKFADSCPLGLDPFPVATCAAMTRHLAEKWDPDTDTLIAPLTQDDQVFIGHEQLRCKVDERYWLERYAQIVKGADGLQPLFPLWQSQEMFLTVAAEQEWARADTGHPDGVLLDVCKARQLGISSLTQALLAHRCTTHTYTRALIASDVPENSGSDGLFGMLELTVSQLPWWLAPREAFHVRDRSIQWKNGSRIVVESGRSMKGALKEQGGKKGQIGRSRTYSTAHISEISTWQNPEQLNEALMPAIPMSSRTFMVRESTAKGRENFWHREWQKTCAGATRFAPLFIGWYVEDKKYWLPAPVDWSPTADTLGVARVIEADAPRWLGRPFTPTRHQLYWYEFTRAGYTLDGRAQDFLEEYPTTAEEAFQYSGRSIFPLHVIERTRAHAKPVIDLWRVEAETLLSLRTERE